MTVLTVCVMHRVAAAALIGDDGVLLVRRRADLQHAASLWSFPGGHIEPGETPREAVQRELREEVGLHVHIGAAPDRHIVEGEDQPDGLDISLWIVRQWSGTPVNAAPEENDGLRWVTAADLPHLKLAHWSCRSVIEALG